MPTLARESGVDPSFFAEARLPAGEDPVGRGADQGLLAEHGVRNRLDLLVVIPVRGFVDHAADGFGQHDPAHPIGQAQGEHLLDRGDVVGHRLARGRIGRRLTAIGHGLLGGARAVFLDGGAASGQEQRTHDSGRAPHGSATPGPVGDVCGSGMGDHGSPSLGGGEWTGHARSGRGRRRSSGRFTTGTGSAGRRCPGGSSRGGGPHRPFRSGLRRGARWVGRRRRCGLGP